MAACPVPLITFWRLTATGLPASLMLVCRIDGPQGLARASKQSGPKQSHFIHPSGKKIQTSNMQRPKRQECRLAHQMGARRPGRPTSGNAELLHAFAGPACSYLWYINCNLGCIPNWMHLLDLFLPLIWYWLQVCILGKIWYAYFVHKIYI